jgi:hypothetical protein
VAGTGDGGEGEFAGGDGGDGVDEGVGDEKMIDQFAARNS